MIEAKLPKNVWTYAVRAASYIRNRRYQARVKMTPFQMLTGRKPQANKMAEFGTKCFGYSLHKKKLDERCQEGIFIGFDNRSPAYLREENVVRKYRTVSFGKPMNNEPKFSDDEDDVAMAPRTAENQTPVATANNSGNAAPVFKGTNSAKLQKMLQLERFL